jgi:hypothetical protein
MELVSSLVTTYPPQQVTNPSTRWYISKINMQNQNDHQTIQLISRLREASPGIEPGLRSYIFPPKMCWKVLATRNWSTSILQPVTSQYVQLETQIPKWRHSTCRKVPVIRQHAIRCSRDNYPPHTSDSAGANASRSPAISCYCYCSSGHKWIKQYTHIPPNPKKKLNTNWA